MGCAGRAFSRSTITSSQSHHPPKYPVPFTSRVIAVAALLAPAAAAQSPVYLFSIDWHGPTVGAIDSTGVAITEGDILMPTTPGNMPAFGPLSTPTVAIPHGPGGLGLFPGCAGHLGGTPCVVEVRLGTSKRGTATTVGRSVASRTSRTRWR